MSANWHWERWRGRALGVEITWCRNTAWMLKPLPVAGGALTAAIVGMLIGAVLSR